MPDHRYPTPVRDGWTPYEPTSSDDWEAANGFDRGLRLADLPRAMASGTVGLPIPNGMLTSSKVPPTRQEWVGSQEGSVVEFLRWITEGGREANLRPIIASI